MEIQEYFPSVIKETEEFISISNAENPLFNDLWNNLDYILNEVFIMTMGIDGILRFEKILNIVPENDDLEERRAIIIALLFYKAPYTLPFLEEKSKIYFGDETTVTIDYDNYAVFIRADKNYNENKRIFKILLKKILPANMIYYLIQYIKTSSELKLRLNVGGSIYVKIPAGIKSDTAFIAVKSVLGGSKFTNIPLAVKNDNALI